MALASAHEDAEFLVQKTALLEGELVEECLARDVAEVNSHYLSEAAGEESTVGGAALRHTKMAGELATLRTVVSSTVESALGHSPNEIFHVEVVGELVAGI
jgi:hypothetical protein